MKRISISLLLLCVCTLPVTAGQIKIHSWPTQLVPLEVSTIDVLMSVGYYIHILDQKPMTVDQDSGSNDPYHTYTGCKNINVETNFACQLLVDAAPASAAEGSWVPTLSPDLLPIGTTTVQLCIVGYNVKIEKLIGGTSNIKVAEVTISVLPE